jgi:hypothetical protein
MDRFNLLRHLATSALVQGLSHPNCSGRLLFLACRIVDQRARVCLVIAMLEVLALSVVLLVLLRAQVVVLPAHSRHLEHHLDSARLSKCPLAPVAAAAPPRSSDRLLDLDHDQADSLLLGRLEQPHRMLVLKKAALRLRKNGTLRRRRLLPRVALRGRRALRSSR